MKGRRRASSHLSAFLLVHAYSPSLLPSFTHLCLPKTPATRMDTPASRPLRMETVTAEGACCVFFVMRIGGRDRCSRKCLRDLSRTKILRHISARADMLPRLVYDLRDRFQKTFAAIYTSKPKRTQRVTEKYERRTIPKVRTGRFISLPQILDGRFHFITRTEYIVERSACSIPSPLQISLDSEYKFLR